MDHNLEEMFSENPSNAIKEASNELATGDDDSNSRASVKIEAISEKRRDGHADR